MTLHQVLAGYITHDYYMPGTTTKLSTPFQVLVLWLHLHDIGLGITVTEIKVAENPVVSRSTNLESKLIRRLCLVKLVANNQFWESSSVHCP